MIITFHLLAYIIFKIRDKIILNFSSSSDDDSNDQPGPSIENERNTNSQTQGEATYSLQDQHLPIREEPGPRHLNQSQPNSPETHKKAAFHSESVIDVKSLIYNVKPTFECIIDEYIGLRFIPPVYIQRYMVIKDILNERCWQSTVKKVVDFGCAELKFANLYLKKLFGIEEIIAVDIDEEVLSHYSCVMQPSIPEFLERRPSPLNVKIFCGSVGVTNEVLIGCDAVVAIELIEHLFPEDLENVPFTVFGYIRPKIAIFTTPNADFNVLFTNFSGMRHDDHKFEWSRQQFEDWASNIVLRYPDYSVTFKGVGPGPEGTEHLGCCSQMAVFVRQYGSSSLVAQEMNTQNGDYKLINVYDHPWDNRTRDEKIRDEALGFINQFKILSRHIDEEQIREIHLKTIMEQTKCYSRDRLKNILNENNIQIVTNDNGIDVIQVSDTESSDGSESWVNDNEEYTGQDGVHNEFLHFEEDWDCVETEGNLNLENTIEMSRKCSDQSEVSSNSQSFITIAKCNNLNSEEVSFSYKNSHANDSGIENSLNNKVLQEKISVSDLKQANSFSLEMNNTIGANHYVENIQTEKDSNKEFNIPNSKCCVSDRNGSVTSEGNSEYESFCSVDDVVPITSNCTSTYSTPFCSKLHRHLALSNFTSKGNNGDESSFSPGIISFQRSKEMHSNDQDQNITRTSKCQLQSHFEDRIAKEICSDVNFNKSLENLKTKIKTEENHKNGRIQTQILAGDFVHRDMLKPQKVNFKEEESSVSGMEEDFIDFEAQIEDIQSSILLRNDEDAQKIQICCRSRSDSEGEQSMDIEDDQTIFEAKLEDMSTQSDAITKSECSIVSNCCYLNRLKMKQNECNRNFDMDKNSSHKNSLTIIKNHNCFNKSESLHSLANRQNYSETVVDIIDNVQTCEGIRKTESPIQDNCSMHFDSQSFKSLECEVSDSNFPPWLLNLNPSETDDFELKQQFSRSNIINFVSVDTTSHHIYNLHQGASGDNHPT